MLSWEVFTSDVRNYMELQATELRRGQLQGSYQALEWVVLGVTCAASARWSVRFAAFCLYSVVQTLETRPWTQSNVDS